MPRWDYSQFQLRWPRHAVGETARLEAQLERSGVGSARVVDVELLDVSRLGFRFRLPFALAPGESVLVHVRTEGLPHGLTLAGRVRWQRADGEFWVVGCAADRPIDWEILGELFLNHVLEGAGPEPLDEPAPSRSVPLQ